MNLEESNDFIDRQRKNSNRKRVIVISMVFCAVIAALLAIMILIIKYQDSLKLKMYVDGKQVKLTSTMFTEVDGITYINIREFADLTGYNYQKGEYRKYTEDIESCYISNNFETVAITADTDSYEKYIIPVFQKDQKTPILANLEVTIKSEEEIAEIFKIENPVKLINNTLYMEFKDVIDVFNVQVDLSKENRIYVYTLTYVVSNAIKQLPSLGYTDISGNYENLKALIYGIAVVGRDNMYGVVNTATREEIAGIKYNEIVFVQNVKEFLVTAEKTVGLISSEGNTIIKPTDYDEISVLDQVNGLYLVKKDTDYGVLNRSGDVVVYVEYNEIGYKNTKNFVNQDISNPKLLFNVAIPVEKAGMFGLYDTEGTELLRPLYDGFGYIPEKTDNLNEEGIMIIPETVGIKGIVISQKGQYGIFDVESKSIAVPCVCTKIYSVTKSGQTTYYMEYNGEQIDISKHLEDNNLVSVKKNTNTKTSSEDNLNF